MSSKGRRRVTVDSSKALPESSSSEKRKPSVFERLGQAPRSSYDQPKGECHNWSKSGRCSYGKSCKYPHPPHLAAGKRDGGDLRHRVSRKRHRDDSDSENEQSSDSDSEESIPREKQSKSSVVMKRDKDGKMKSQVVVTKHAYDSDSDTSNPPQNFYDRDTEILLKQRQMLQRELSRLSKEEDGESDRNSGRPEQVHQSSSDSSSDVATPLRLKSKHKSQAEESHGKKKLIEKKKKKKAGKQKVHRSPSSDSARERSRERMVSTPKAEKEKEREPEREKERERKEKLVKEKAHKKHRERHRSISSDDSRTPSPRLQKERKYSDSSSEDQERSPIEKKKKSSVVMKKKASPEKSRHFSPEQSPTRRLSREKVKEKIRKQQLSPGSYEKMGKRLAASPSESSRDARHRQESEDRGRSKQKRSLSPSEDFRHKKEVERERVQKSKQSVSPQPSRQYLEVKSAEVRKASRTPEQARRTPRQERSLSPEPKEKVVKDIKRQLKKVEKTDRSEKERPDRERSSRQEQVVREERDRTERAERVERDRYERQRVERAERGERYEKERERPEKLERHDRHERQEGLEVVVRSERTDRERHEQPERVERERYEAQERERSDHPERSDRDRRKRQERTERVERVARPDRSEKSERADRERVDRERVERDRVERERVEKAERHKSPSVYSRSKDRSQREVSPEVKGHKGEQWEKMEAESSNIPLKPVQERLKRLTEMSSLDLLPKEAAAKGARGRSRETSTREVEERAVKRERERERSRRKVGESPELVEPPLTPEKRSWRQRQAQVAAQPAKPEASLKVRRKHSKEVARASQSDRSSDREREILVADDIIHDPHEIIEREPRGDREMREMQRQAQLYEQERDRLHALDARQRELEHRGRHVSPGDVRARQLQYEEYEMMERGLSPASYDRYMRSRGRGRYEELVEIPHGIEAAYPVMDEREERYLRERYEREHERALLDRHGQPREGVNTGRDVEAEVYYEDVYRGDIRRRERLEAHGRPREQYPEEALARDRGRYDERERYRHEAEQYALEQATRRQWEEHEARMASREAREARSYDRRGRRTNEEEVLLAQSVRVHRDGSPAGSHHSASSRSRSRHDAMERDLREREQYAREWQQQEELRLRQMQQLEIVDERGGRRDRSSSRFREETKRRRSPSMDQYIQERKRTRVEHEERREEGLPPTEWSEEERDEAHLKEERRHREELIHHDPHRIVEPREPREPREARGAEPREARPLEAREARGFEERVRRSPSRSSIGSRKSHRDEVRRTSESGREQHAVERPERAERPERVEREEAEREGRDSERERGGRRERGEWERGERPRGNWEKREDRSRRVPGDNEDGVDSDAPSVPPTVTPLMDLPPPPHIAEMEAKESLTPTEAVDEEKLQLEEISDDDLDLMIEKANTEQPEEVEEDAPAPVDIVDIDWKSLIQSTKPKPATESSALKRFAPHVVLASIGVSHTLAGDSLMSKVLTLCQKNVPESEKGVKVEAEDTNAEKEREIKVEIKTEVPEETEVKQENEKSEETSEDKSEKMSASVKNETAVQDTKTKSSKFEFLHELAGFHALATRKRQERLGLLRNLGPYRRALCARRDLRIRQQLCHMEKEVEGDLFPAQVVDQDLYKQSLQLFKHDKDLVAV